MELKDVINRRHSIREYEKKLVSKKILKELISDASKAPSAKNEQNWFFYIISKIENRNKVIEILHSYLRENKIEFNKINPEIREIAQKFYSNLGDAPNIIFIYRNKKNNSPVYQNFNDIASISCAIENLMLSATNKGLGSCWVGSFKDKEKEISNLVGAEKNQELMATVLVGYPRKVSKILIRDKKKLNEIVKFI